MGEFKGLGTISIVTKYSVTYTTYSGSIILWRHNEQAAFTLQFFAHISEKRDKFQSQKDYVSY